MHPRIFSFFRDESLPKPLRILKRLGQIGMWVFVVYAIVYQLNGNKFEGTPLLDTLRIIVSVAVFVSFGSFTIIAMFAAGKTSQNTMLQAIGRSLLKIFLYMFLPAIVITIILMVALYPRN